MSKFLIASLSLILLVTGCAGTNVRNEPPPPVQDKSIQPNKPTEPGNASAGGGESAGVKNDDVKGKRIDETDKIPAERSVYFDYDAVGFQEKYRQVIESHAKYLTKHPTVNVMLQGNTDERGGREYNLALGNSRAAAVQKVLGVFGVPSKQIETSSYGREMPVCTEQNEACWSRNRRVDFYYENDK